QRRSLKPASTDGSIERLAIIHEPSASNASLTRRSTLARKLASRRAAVSRSFDTLDKTENRGVADPQGKRQHRDSRHDRRGAERADGQILHAASVTYYVATSRHPRASACILARSVDRQGTGHPR